jgi:hypothetical protein
MTSYGKWLERRQHVKERPQPAFYAVLTGWIKDGDALGPLPSTTFDYVIQYMANREQHPRLGVGLGDIGYTREELDALLSVGKTALDVAREVVARGVDTDD